MSIETLLAQMIPDLRVVNVRFKDCNGQPVGREYSYKTMDAEVIVGDTVVVDTPSTGLQCVVVTKVTDATALEVQSSINYKWIIQRVDMAEYNKCLANDEKVGQTIALAQKAAAVRRAKAELDALLEASGLTAEQVGELNETLNSYKG